MDVLRRRVETTGWSCLVLGAVCLMLAGFEAVAPILIRAMTEAMGDVDEPTSAAVRSAFAHGAATSAVVNGLLGAGLVVVGIAIARRVSWAHPATTVAAWVSIAALLAVIQPSVRPFLAMSGGGRGARISIVVISVLLFAAQVVLVFVFLRFWRRPEVTALFDPAQRGR